jgi:SPP1 gp7 family putative phage head morphogenesis protein
MSFNRINTDGKVLKSNEYWAKRSIYQFENSMKDVDKINKWLQHSYNEVLKDIERDIELFLSKNQDIKDINKPVTIKEYNDTMKDLWKRYHEAKYKFTNSAPVQKRIMNQINGMNARYRRTRLEVLHDQIKGKLDLQGLENHDKLVIELGEVYKNTFDQKHFELAKGLGYGWQYSTPPWKVIEDTILYPWAKDGSMFSDRIWDMTDRQADAFTKAVRRTIASDMVAMGKHPSRVAKNVVGFGNPALSKQQIKQNATRLLYTEATHIIEEANVKVSEEWGITHYIYLATLDNKTSTVCQRLDGSRYAFKDRIAGTNFAPMHPNCRSTHYDDIPNNLYGKRASRNKDGKTVHEVPHDVTYEQ